jgi:hypothetical protein
MAKNFVPIDVMSIDEAIALLNQLCPDKTRDPELTAKLAELCGRLPLALTIVGELTLGSLLTLVKLEQDLERLRLLKYHDRELIDLKCWTRLNDYNGRIPAIV